MLHIIPQPNHLEVLEGAAAFSLSEGVSFSGDGIPAAAMADFRDFLSRAFSGCGDKAAGSSIVLRLLDGERGSEAYTLDVDADKIVIASTGEAGVFYGLQTLKQLLLQGDGSVPALHLEDRPLYAYRGFMLDCGRYFYPVADVKRMLDQMALHKLNVFHWHLTEDQGWRIEIKRYPALTQHGSRRSHTNFGVRPHGGFYTQEQIREIVAYAHSKYIRVVPEIDMPGHMVAAIACDPELSCFSRRLPVATHWGVKHDILCAGKESTYSFVFNVLDEVASLFPDGMIHIGGDEAVKMRWKLCPACQAAIETLGLRDEEELQQYFMSRVNRYLKEKGIVSVMWNWDSMEATPQLDCDIVWQMCGYPENTRAEIEAGRKMIFSNSFFSYLDFPYGWASLRQAYEQTPEISELDEKTAENLLGVEAPLWTEYVPNRRRAEYQTYPRLGALAELAWSRREDRSFARFLSGMEAYEKLLRIYGIKPASLRQAMPGRLRAACTSLWFNRRQLHWQGLHNLIDDAKVKRLAQQAKTDS